MLIESLYFIYLFTNDKEVMAEDLTQWERHEIEAIDKLIQIGKLQKIAFEREHLMLNKQAVNPHLPFQTFRNGLEGREKQRLLNLAENLCSALDMLCRLIYCHHCNNGSNSTEAENVKFPSKVVKRSDNAQKVEFAKEHFNITFTDEQDYDRFEAIILGCFGVHEQADWILKILHFLRNHRESVDVKETSHQGQANRCVTFGSNSDTFYMQPESLITFTSKVLPFVRDTRNSLLEKCFPEAYPTFDDDKVGLDVTGVHIGTGQNHIRHTLQTFDQNCFNNNFQSYFV